MSGAAPDDADAVWEALNSAKAIAELLTGAAGNTNVDLSNGTLEEAGGAIIEAMNRCRAAFKRMEVRRLAASAGALLKVSVAEEHRPEPAGS